MGHKPSPFALVALLAAAALVAVACASPMRVDAKNQIATARYAIYEAENREAQLYAPEEIALARAKLEEAQNAKLDVAGRLAQQATVNAQLAGAISARESARAQLAEARRVQRAAGTLRSETTEAVQETQR
jgi:hypothetical protein